MAKKPVKKRAASTPARRQVKPVAAAPIAWPKVRYSPHPSIQMVIDWIATLEAKTGRNLEAWIALAVKEGGKDEASRRKFLAEKHGLGTNSAWWIAERSVGKGGEDSDPALYLKAAETYVQEMFGGAKALLVPIYGRLLDLARATAADIKFCPCKTIVPFYRKHVIAQVKPSTRTRIDFGLALGDRKGSGRLVETGGFAKKDRITHKITISAPEDVDAEVRRWLKEAYDRDA